jgi:LysM repeat protein
MIARLDEKYGLARSRMELAFDPNQARDWRGRWTAIGAAAAAGIAGVAARIAAVATPGNKATSPATRAAATQPAIPDEYKVRSGDTLSSIAKKLTGNAQNSKLLTNVPSGDPEKIYPDDRIPLPEEFKQKMREFQGQTSTTQPASTRPNGTTQPATQPASPNVYKVVPGDTPWKIAQKLTGNGPNWHLLPIIHPGQPNRLDIGDPIPLPEAFQQKMREFQGQTSTTQPAAASKPPLQSSPVPAVGKSKNLATPENIKELATVLMSEASRQKEAEQIAVGNTVLNRMKRKNNTDNVKDVTTSPAYSHNQPPSPEMIDLATRMLKGEVADNTNGATHFYSPGAMPKDANGQPTVPDFARKFPKVDIPGVRDEKFRFYKAPGDEPVQ